jgi:hypothetical protein
MWTTPSRLRPAAAVVGLLLSLLLAAVVAAPADARPARRLIHLSTDPYTNTFSAHQTEVEPDSFAAGSTIVSAFQVGRVFIGAAANIGWATSRNRGKTWRHGFLPATTIQASPAGPYARVSDPSVAYDARHHTWLISWLATRSITSNAVVDLLVSRSRSPPRTSSSTRTGPCATTPGAVRSTATATPSWRMSRRGRWCS